MSVPIALIVQCSSTNERRELGKRLQEIIPSDCLQSVVRSGEGDYVRWEWDRVCEQPDFVLASVPLVNCSNGPAVAIPCTSKLQFDELQVWLRNNDYQTVECGIGIDQFPTLVYFAADWNYARENLRDS